MSKVLEWVLKLTPTGSLTAGGSLRLTQVWLLRPGFVGGLMAGEPAAMSPAIQHHVLGFSHLLHSSWQPAEGAFSLYFLGPPCSLEQKDGCCKDVRSFSCFMNWCRSRRVLSSALLGQV